MLKTKVCAAFKMALLTSQTCSGDLRNEIQPLFTVKDTLTACNSCDLRFTLPAGIGPRDRAVTDSQQPTAVQLWKSPKTVYTAPLKTLHRDSLEKPIFPLPDAPHSFIWASFP